MADTVYQRLREHLHYLGLRAAADQLAPSLEAAERDKPGYTRFLHDLLDHEVSAVEQRRMQGRMRFAKLPARKTLEQFDWAAQPNLDRRMVEDLATLRFIEEKANVLLIGPPGVGKTMLATALGHRAVEAGYGNLGSCPVIVSFDAACVEILARSLAVASAVDPARSTGP